MKLTKRISFRLPLNICLLTCGLLYFLSYLIENSFEKYSVEQNVSELNSVIYSIESELSYYSASKHNDELNQNLLLILTGHHRLFVYIVDESGKIVYRTRGPNLLLVQSQVDFKSITQDHSTIIWDVDNFSYRVAASKLNLDNGKEFTTIVAVNQDVQMEFINRLHDGLRLLMFLACIIALITTLIAIYFTQRPFNALIKKIELINSQSLDERIPSSSVPSKYVSLVEAFNDMLNRMQDVFQRQHNFIADIAHEMRTPITNLTTQTQIALNNARTKNEYREILYSNLEEYERMSQMISDMFFLAQADNKELIPNLEDIDVVNTMAMMCDYFEPLTDEKNISIKLEGSCCHVQGDKMMLRRAIANILSNAIRYTPENQHIAISLNQINEKRVKIEISNPGIKIESKHLPHLFDRFYRVDESRQRNGEGAGIGLAIVKSIIDAHQGFIFVESDDVCTKFTLSLPVSMN